MLRNKLSRLFTAVASGVLALSVSAGLANAAATTKTLSTNYTLVNLGSANANVTVNYYKEDGSSWEAATENTSFTVGANGGQRQIRQYTDTTMQSGRGSAVVASDQPLGAVVQILARSPQVATQGAYIGSSETANSFYVPLVMRNRASASGVTSSQIMVQNAGTGTATVSVQLVKAAASPGASYTKSGISIPSGATYYYDLTDELASNVADNWYGSAVVTSTGSAISVISNLFAGTHQLQTFNGFMPTDLTTKWFVPLFASRLTNGLNTPVAVQNLSGGTLNVGDVDLVCTPNASRTGISAFTASNTAAIGSNESYFFNPVIDTSIPANWNGSCVLTATGNTAVFVQMRQPGVNDFAASYEAISGTSTDRRVLVPLIGKNVGSTGFSTPVSIQNLGNADTTVTITYTPSATECVGCSSYTETNVTIPANSAIDRNFRQSTTVPAMPSGWVGTMTVVSASQPIGGFVQITSLRATVGDTLMAHGVFTQP